MPFSRSRTPDAVFRLAAASRLEGGRTTPGFGLIPLPPIVRLWSRDDGPILQAIGQGFAGGIAERIGERLEPGSTPYKPLQAAAKRGRLRGLKLFDLEAGDEAEVADINGQNREAKLQRRDADKQVSEGDRHALGLLFAVDLCGQ